MLKINIRKVICLITVAVFLISTNVAALNNTNTYVQDSSEDIDPLVDLEVTVTIKEIRALDKIDLIGNPDFYVKVSIDNVVYSSPVWRNKKYVKPNWSITHDVLDYKEDVSIKIELWDWNLLGDKRCDISRNGHEVEKYSDYGLELIYSLKNGHWTGDDYIHPNPTMFDPSGYGRANGCDDNSIYQFDRDCELWFDISQNDYDGDGIPYWTEVNNFGTDPRVDDTGMDCDGDNVPIEWEYKWGYYPRWWHGGQYWLYDPFEWDDHKGIDLDMDGLDNVEEFLTSKWGSDPFRKDVFLELDQMEKGPNNEGNTIPELTKDLLADTFSKHNIVFRIDDSGELIPFDNVTEYEELQELYWNYFLERDPNNWKRGALHYGLIIYRSARHPGFVFSTNVNGVRLLDSFQVSTRMHDRIPFSYPLYESIRRKSFDQEYQRAMVYAGAIMHETGHVFGIFKSNTPGCDTAKRKWINYKSCMNYRFIYCIIDYSDGSHGKNDYDDWSRIDLTLFQKVGT